MRFRIAVAAVLMAAAGCVSGAEMEAENEAEAISGLYRQGFEQSDFYPDTGGGPWWFTYDGDLWSQIEPYARRQGRGMFVVVRMEVEGNVSAPGRYGHVGAYERELVASRIVSVESASQTEFEAAAEAAAKK